MEVEHLPRNGDVYDGQGSMGRLATVVDDEQRHAARSTPKFRCSGTLQLYQKLG